MNFASEITCKYINSFSKIIFTCVDVLFRNNKTHIKKMVETKLVSSHASISMLYEHCAAQNNRTIYTASDIAIIE